MFASSSEVWASLPDVDDSDGCCVRLEGRDVEEDDPDEDEDDSTPIGREDVVLETGEDTPEEKEDEREDEGTEARRECEDDGGAMHGKLKITLSNIPRNNSSSFVDEAGDEDDEADDATSVGSRRVASTP